MNSKQIEAMCPDQIARKMLCVSIHWRYAVWKEGNMLEVVQGGKRRSFEHDTDILTDILNLLE